MTLANQATQLLGKAAQRYRELTAYPRPICRVVVDGRDITADITARNCVVLPTPA